MSPDGDGTAVKDNVSNSTPAKDHRLVIDGLSLQKLDKLQSVVIDRLGGGGFGDWWVHGHKSSNDNRHLALEEVFALKRAIEDLNTTLTQQGRAPELLDKEIKANSKAAVTMNTKTKETMRSLVAQEMEDKMRDIKIETTRVKERLAALEKENKDLLEMVKSLGAKTKKPGEPTAANNGQKIRALEKTIADLKRETADAQSALKEDMGSMKQTQVVSQKSLTSCFTLAQRLDREMTALRADFKDTKEDASVWVKRIENLELQVASASDPEYEDEYPCDEYEDDEEEVDDEDQEEDEDEDEEDEERIPDLDFYHNQCDWDYFHGEGLSHEYYYED